MHSGALMVLILTEELTIRTVAAVKATLVEALRTADAVTLDGAGVQEVDLAGLQLLCSLHRTGVASDKPIAFVNGRRSQVIDEIAVKAGFPRHVGCTSGCLWLGCPRG